jgi:hypothetical protein
MTDAMLTFACRHISPPNEPVPAFTDASVAEVAAKLVRICAQARPITAEALNEKAMPSVVGVRDIEDGTENEFDAGTEKVIGGDSDPSFWSYISSTYTNAW